MDNISVKVEMKFDRERISDLLCCALEGGSNYWYRIESFKEPTSFEFYSDTWAVRNGQKPVVYKHLDYPLNPGGEVVISNRMIVEGSDDLVTKIVDFDALKVGLQLMADKYPASFSEFMEQNEDATTGDVFLQCVVLGRVMYG